MSDQNGRVSRISGTRPESAPEPPGRQVYESAGARRPKAARPLDPLQSAADTAPADVRVRERCEGGRLDGKDWTPVNGNVPEALVAASFFDEFLQQNGELARDEPLACEALAGSFLECQSPSTIDPLSACNIDPLSGTAEVVSVVNRGDPSGFV